MKRESKIELSDRKDRSIKTLGEIERILTEHKEEFRRKYSITEIGIFGSFARGEQTSTSDIDILVDFDKLPDLFKFCEIERVMEELLGIKVDLVRKPAIRKELVENILSEVIQV